MGYKMSWEREDSSDDKFESIQHGYTVDFDDEIEDEEFDLDDNDDVEFDLDEWEEM